MAITFWLLQPLFLRYIVHSPLSANRFMIDIFFFTGVAIVLLLSVYIHFLSIQYFPVFRQARAMWVTTLCISLFALATVFSELLYYRNYFSGTITTLSLVAVIVYLGFQFLHFRKLRKNENA